MAKQHKIGEMVVWKDRPGRIRVMECTKYGMQEARRVEYTKKYKDKELDGYRILQLDMNPFNFRKDNLVKVTVLEMNLLLNNNLLAKTDDFKFNKKSNKMALQVIRNNIQTKKITKILEEMEKKNGR